MFPDAGRSRRRGPLVVINSGCMILVDTSVWIRFFSNQAPYGEHLDALLDRGEVGGHVLIYGELLIGDRGGREKFLAIYEKLLQASMIPHREVVSFVRTRKLH